ncbi:MAG: hypothetical protein E6G27_03465 [Actinobacteria bacterium]|nr:MAG: hypothetical protein E6G27_03465 [Actinomycetota bacterium]
MTFVARFARFWFDFIVGDDWRLAVGVVIVLGAVDTAVSGHPGLWWILPASIAALLAVSVRTAARKTTAARRLQS